MCFRSKSRPTLTMRAMRSTAARPGAMRIAIGSGVETAVYCCFSTIGRNLDEP